MDKNVFRSARIFMRGKFSQSSTRLLVVIGLSALMSGCVFGFTTITSESIVKYDYFDLSPSASKSKVVEDSTGSENPDKDLVLKTLGQPSDVEISGNVEYYIYNNGLDLRGVILWFILPIPLALPIGFEQTKIAFVDNESVGVELFQGHKKNYVCAFTPHEHDSPCFVE